MIVTRYLSDAIYKRDVAECPWHAVRERLFSCGPSSWSWPERFISAMPNSNPRSRSAPVVNFLLLSAVWLVGIFISALRNYNHHSPGHFLRHDSSRVSSMSLAKNRYGAVWAALTAFRLACPYRGRAARQRAHRISTYPVRNPFAFMPYSRRSLAVGAERCGLQHGDLRSTKWVMWFAPEAVKMKSNSSHLPRTTAPMFIAYLTTVPAMALFVQHRNAFSSNIIPRFLSRHLNRTASFARIQKNHLAVMRSIFAAPGNFLHPAGQHQRFSVR